MDAMEFARVVSTLGPIVGLMITGLAITVRSGVVNYSSHQGLRQMAWNLSEAALLLAGCLFCLLFLQQLSGVHIHMGLLG